MGELQQLVYENGTYKTPVKGSVRFPNLIFYKKLVNIIVNASRKAKRGRYSYEEWIEDNLRVIKNLEGIGVEFEIRGIEKIIPLQGRPSVIIANHMSTLETFTLAGILYPFLKVTFVVKESLVKIPVFKHIMRSRKPIIVTRVNPREDLKKVLEDGVKRLSEGYSIIIFPQTTRVYVFDPNEFNSIGVKLAKRAGVPVIPLALRTDSWQQGKIIKDFGKIDTNLKVSFIFGEPVFIEGNGQKEHKEVLNFIVENLKELQVPVL